MLYLLGAVYFYQSIQVRKRGYRIGGIMSKISICLLMLFSLSLYAEEISPLLMDRKKGSMNITVTDVLLFSQAGPNYMNTTEMENYLWGTSSSLYSEVNTFSDDFGMSIEVAGDYYLTGWFGLHAAIAYEKRKFSAEWWESGYSGHDAVFSLGIDYLTLSFGGRLFLWKFYLGVDVYFSLPVSTTDGSLIATHATESTHTETPEFDASPDYGLQFSLGWRWRWSERLFCDIGARFYLGFAKFAEAKAFAPVSDFKNYQSVSYYAGLSYAIR